MSTDLIPGMWSEDGIHGTCSACMGWLKFQHVWDRLPDGCEGAFQYVCIDCGQTTIVRTPEYRLYEDNPEYYAEHQEEIRTERIRRSIELWNRHNADARFGAWFRPEPENPHMYCSRLFATLDDAKEWADTHRAEGHAVTVYRRFVDESNVYHEEVVE